VATMGVAALRGLQGDDGLGGPNHYLGSPKTHVMAQAKHFGAYGFGGFDGYSADISTRTIYERYLYPWLRFAQEGGKGAMASHNSINYEPVHGSHHWMTDVFRNQLGFGEGFIGADSHNVLALYSTQRVAVNVSDAAVLAVEAGLDQDLNGLRNTPYGSLADNTTYVNISAVDRAASNVLRYKFAVGLFDTPFADPSLFGRRDDEGARQLAREAARQSMVLLKNKDSMLPLNSVLQDPTKKVLLIGQIGSQAMDMLGDYNPKTGVPVDTIQEALQNRSKATIQYIEAAGPKMEFNISGAVDQFMNWADVTIAVVGDSTANSMGFSSESCGEMADRANLDVPGPQYDLLAALSNASSKTSRLVVVMIHGRPVTFGPKNFILNDIDALIAAWRPGEEGAGALIDLIDGTTNPSAKLTQAWPQSSGFVRSAAQPWMQDFAANANPPKDYWDDSLAPLFPFGFGLSYTSFDIKSAAATAVATPVNINSTFEMTVAIKNTGALEGAVVLQVYAQRPIVRGVNRMQRQLAGFGKVNVLPSQELTMSVPIRLADLARFEPNSREWIVDGGDWSMWVATCAGSAWGNWNTGKDKSKFGCLQSQTVQLQLPQFNF